MAEHCRFDHAPVRILHLFSRLNCGGAEKRTLEVARHIQRQPELRQRIQIDYCVLSGQPGVLDEEARALGGRIHYLPLRQASFPRRFTALLRREGYAVVHSHVHLASGILLELARLAGVPHRIVHFRSQSDGKSYLLRGPLRWLLKRLIDHAAVRILSVSRCVMEAVWGEDWSRDERCQVIYNGIDVDGRSVIHDQEHKEKLVQSLGLPPNSRLMVHVGSYRAPKNHPRLIDIFRQVHRQESRSHLLLVGDLSQGLSQLKSRLASYRLGNVVHFLGLQKDVAHLLRAADVMIFPSLWEGLPGAVLESLAVGTPVVASDIPPHREIASFLPGLTCVPLSAPDEYWAKIICSLVPPAGEDREKAWQLFTESPFSLDRCVASLVAIWEEDLTARHVPTSEPGESSKQWSFGRRRAA